MSTTGRTRIARGATAVIAAALLVIPGSTALADPDVSDQDVRDAQRAVTSASNAVADIEVRLAQLSTESDAAQIQVAQAAETYAQAQADLATAQAAAEQAATASDAAQQKVDDARATLVAIAREAARSGGSMDTLQALLSADGFEDVVERSAALDHVSTKADQAVQTYRAADQVAATLQEQADATAATQKDAAATAEDALADAEKTQADADAAVAAAATEREGLIAQLATARNTSAEVEQQRQDQIDADRRQRAEAAAQAARTQTPAATSPTAPPAAPTTTTPPASTAPPAVTNPPSSSMPPPTTPSTPPTTTTPPTGGSSSGTTSGADAAIAWAKERIGLPYVWGGVGPNGYDCSGLTQGAWRAGGVSLNRTSRDQYKQVQKISYDSMRAGDLVFWGTNPNDASSVYHVAIYLGGGQILEAPSPGQTVRITSMRWSNSMSYAGRP